MKLLILDGDDLTQYQVLKNKFVFLIKKDKVYHIDTTDGEMYLALPNLKNLSKGHQRVIKKAMGEK